MPLTELPSRESLLAEYASMLPNLGWPLWPPDRLPAQASVEWWQTPRRYPPPASRLAFPYRLVENDGTPGAGRSFIEKSLLPLLKYNLGNSREIITWDEGIVSSPPAGIIAFQREISSASESDPAELDGLFISTDATEHLILQYHKALSWIAGINHLQPPSEPPHPTLPPLILGYRGLLDSIIWSYALFAHRQDSIFTLSATDRSLFDPPFKLLIADWHLELRNLAAVVLIGTSREEAVKRHRKKDKKYPALVADSPFFNDLSDWYGYWADHIWPNYPPKNRPGLLVLNGEDSPDDNLDILSQYLLELI